MNRKYKSLTIFLLAINSLVSGCGSRQVSGPIDTQTPTMTSTLTQTPAFTLTYTLTMSLTPLPTPTITYIPFPDAPSLSALMLSPSDIIMPVEEDSNDADQAGALFGIYPGFNPPDLSVLDKSQELKSICIIECTWQAWFRGGYTVQITMIRSQDEQEASHTASKLYNALKPFDWEVGERDLMRVNAPIQNTHIGASGNRGIVLITSRGPIAIHVILYGSFSDNPSGFISPEIAFTNLQINKLLRENIIP